MMMGPFLFQLKSEIHTFINGCCWVVGLVWLDLDLYWYCLLPLIWLRNFGNQVQAECRIMPHGYGPFEWAM